MVAKPQREHKSQDNFATYLHVQAVLALHSSNIHKFQSQDLVNNVDTAASREILAAQPEEHSEGELTEVNDGSGCNGKNKDVSRE